MTAPDSDEPQVPDTVLAEVALRLARLRDNRAKTLARKDVIPVMTTKAASLRRMAAHLDQEIAAWQKIHNFISAGGDCPICGKPGVCLDHFTQ